LTKGKNVLELREHERQTLSALNKLRGKASVEQLLKESGLTDSGIMRAALVLQEIGLAKIQAERQTVLKLNGEGKLHAKKGLPERRLVVALAKLGGQAVRDRAFEEAGLEKQFVPIALGWVQKKKWATLDTKTNTLQVSGRPDEGNDEKLLKLLDKKEKASVEDLEPELKEAVQILKGRKLLDVQEKTRHIIELTIAGQAALRKGIEAAPEVTQLTQELIISGKWRKVKLQKYNIEAAVAKTWPGKKHPYLQFLEEVREKLVTLGFKEMVGTFVEMSLFNFDALYTPQDHPARETSGIYFVKSPREGRTDAYKRIIGNIKRTHENGWKTGSSGWRYRYSLKEAKRLILRGHGTCLSARTLVSRDLEIPGRYFSIARCYRPEVVDKTHLTEFNQVEGIIIEKDLTLRDLLGVLETFAIEVAGADKVKFRPDYFPFTEPSVEIAAYKEGYGWLEFGGSGIFRPEVTMPLGIKEPVIAWGLGIDRLFMMKAGIEEIRYIFSQDLDWIRRKAVV
jgi:phenylalanyl-tRNA synthetase alpha chain